MNTEKIVCQECLGTGEREDCDGVCCSCNGLGSNQPLVTMLEDGLEYVSEALAHAINSGEGDYDEACLRRVAAHLGVMAHAQDILESLKGFTATIDASGGLEDGAPVADPEWIDLGIAYVQAAAVIERAES